MQLNYRTTPREFQYLSEANVFPLFFLNWKGPTELSLFSLYNCIVERQPLPTWNWNKHITILILSTSEEPKPTTLKCLALKREVQIRAYPSHERIELPVHLHGLHSRLCWSSWDHLFSSFAYFKEQIVKFIFNLTHTCK